MSLDSLMGMELFKWVILPLLIFLSRILDVSLGTMRIVFISKRLKFLASFLGFFEVLIWLVAINIIMQNLNNVIGYLAYGLGFAMGNYLGIYLEEKLAVGQAILRIITRKNASEFINILRAKGFGVTNVIAKGKDGKVNIIFMAIRRRDYEKVMLLMNQYHPKAFFTLEDVRFAKKGFYPYKKVMRMNPYLKPFKFFRKGK